VLVACRWRRQTKDSGSSPKCGPRVEDEGEGGVVAGSGEGRMKSEVGASRGQYPGGGDPGQDVNGRFGHPALKPLIGSNLGTAGSQRGLGEGPRCVGRYQRGWGKQGKGTGVEIDTLID